MFRLQGFFLVFLIARVSWCQNSCRPTMNESDVLSSLKKELRIEKVWKDPNWTKWEGIDLNTNGRVENITLVNRELKGILRSIWDELTSLVFLDLSQNGIHALNLSGCENRMLRTLKLSSNKLSEIPESMTNLVNLEHLDLSSNPLTGKVPDLESLRYLNLSWTGKNVSFGEYPSLEVLDFSYNNYSGDISAEVWKNITTKMRGLKVLNISSNQLGGEVSQMFGELRNLTRLVLSDNSFAGDLPSDLENCTQLYHLDVTNNQLTGGIPPSLGRLPELLVLSAGHNQLSNLSVEAGGFPKLQTLYLIGNNFTWIPRSIGNFKNLKFLYLQENSLQGEIPPEIGDCTALGELWLNENHLVSPIPSKLCNLPQLYHLVLNNNNFSGTIPPSLGNCTKLRVLWLENNNFSGELPRSLGNLASLLMLSVGSNQLTGNIPDSYRNLKSLKGLDVGTNSLSGEIPACLGELASLQFLFMTRNGFTSFEKGDMFANLTFLRALDLSSNSLTGSIPPELSELFKNVPLYRYTNESAFVHNDHLTYVNGFATPTTIDLSNNSFTGSIPPELGNLTKLQVLDLSRNQLTGSIPENLGSARNLSRLSLSYNNLSGSIPQSLAKLMFLSVLDVSYNKLEGWIPNSAQISSMSPSFFEGNEDLCGIPIHVTCNISGPGVGPQESGSGSFKRRIIPVFVTVCAVFFSGLVAVFIVLSRRRHKLYSSNGETCCEKNFSMAFSEKLPEHILPEKLAAATNNYSQGNVVGDGGFGVVYKAVLETGVVVAVKKLTSGGLQGDREFHAELQTLGDLSHKNLVPLLGYCSDGSERLLIYKYLKNGSLDTWLYCREPGVKPLDWATRLKILRGAAQGVAYLHEEMEHPSIVHRDIKVSNILLDEEFEAHVADFGLARLVGQGDTHVSTDVAGTIGYIPPEYNHKCYATPKGDVYSFGVVCLEILTSKRPTDHFIRKTGAGHLVAWIQGLKSLEEFREALDTSLLLACDEQEVGSCSSNGGRLIEQMKELMKIACCCCRDAPSKRPSMQEVANLLERLERICLMSMQARCSTDHVEINDSGMK